MPRGNLQRQLARRREMPLLECCVGMLRKERRPLSLRGGRSLAHLIKASRAVATARSIPGTLACAGMTFFGWRRHAVNRGQATQEDRPSFALSYSEQPLEPVHNRERIVASVPEQPSQSSSFGRFVHDVGVPHQCAAVSLHVPEPLPIFRFAQVARDGALL